MSCALLGADCKCSPCFLTASVSQLRVIKRQEHRALKLKKKARSCWDPLLVWLLTPQMIILVYPVPCQSKCCWRDNTSRHTLTIWSCHLGDWLCHWLWGEMEIQKTIIPLHGSRWELSSPAMLFSVSLWNIYNAKTGSRSMQRVILAGWNHEWTWSVALLLFKKDTQYTCELAIPHWFAFLFDFNVFFGGDDFQI